MFKNRAQKKHLKKKILVTKWKIWDIEFLRDQFKLTREGFRVEYDRLGELIDAANTRISQEKEKEDPDKTIMEQLENLKNRYEPDREKLKHQMATIDTQIEGPAPAGGSCLNENIENLRTVVGLLQERIKKL